MPTPQQAQAELRRRAAQAELNRRGVSNRPAYGFAPGKELDFEGFGKRDGDEQIGDPSLPKAGITDVPGIVGRGVVSAELGVGKGVLGTIDAVLNAPDPDRTLGFGAPFAPQLSTAQKQKMAKDTREVTAPIREAKRKIMSAQEKFTPQYSGALAWTTRTISEAVPYMANAAVAGAAFGPAGAFGVGFAVEGDYAYDDAIASGATEEQAQTERVVVGSLNAIIEALQVGRVLKFAKGGKHSLKNFVKLARTKGMKVAGKELKGWSGEVARLSIEEALEEFGQEGVLLGIPAAFRGEYPTKEDGSPDWLAIGERLGGAALGGAVAGPVLGGAGRVLTGRGTDIAQEEEIPPISEAVDTTDLPPVNVYKTTSDSRTGITEEEVVREGERYVDSVTGEDVVLDTEASGSAITPAEATAETPAAPEQVVEKTSNIITNKAIDEAVGGLLGQKTELPITKDLILEQVAGPTLTPEQMAIPPAEEVVQALTPEGEEKPRVRLRAEPRSKKELLWRGHALPDAFGLDEESRRDLMEEVTGKRSMKDMSPEEQEMFVAYTEGLAEQSGVEIEAPVIDRAVTRLQEISKKKEKLTPTEELHQGNIVKLVTRVKSWASEAYHSLQRPERFIEALDGEENGVLNENIWKPAKTADETAVLNTAAGVEEYTRLLEENMIDPTLLIGKVEEVGPGVKLTRDEQIGVYLLSQNENGKRYLNEGMKISDAVMLDVTNNLSETERMLGDWMAEQYESQWPTIIAAAEQAGINIEELAKELNYAPIIRSDVDPLEQVDFTDMLAENFTKESFKPEQGFLEQRKKRAVGKIELSATLMYLNNVRRIERFKAMAPVAKKVGAILRNQEFKDSLNDATYGHGSKLLNTWFRDTIKGYSPTEQDQFSKMTKIMRRNAIVYAIGYNIPSTMRQTLSLSNAMAVNPLMMKHVPLNMAKATRNFSKLRDEVYAKSNLVRTRDYERDLRQKFNKSTIYKKLRGKTPFDQKATAWIKWMDQHTVVVAWKSLYDVAIEQGKGETAAIEYADKYVARTQPMANAKDLPQFFRGGTLAKIISTFQNQINNNWNFYTHDIIGARAKGQIGNVETAYKVMFSYVLPAIAFGMIGRGGLPKSWKQLTVDLVTYPIASIMLLGRLINTAITGWNNSTSIVETGPQKVVSAVRAAGRGDIKSVIKNAAEAVGSIGGVPPTAQMSRTFTGVVDLATGNTQDPRRLIWSEWALEQGKTKSTAPTRRRVAPPVRRRP